MFLLESDVNELAQAKGANVAGLQVVFSAYGIDFEDVEVFYLAGGFGRHLNVEASKRIGLVPNLDPAKIVRAGNTAIEGATIALLSRSKRRELEDLVKKVEHCRLETHPELLRFLRGRLSIQTAGADSVREVAETIELAGTLPEVDVLPEEYVRLLGYPRGWVLEGRARELADWARDWYREEWAAVVLCEAGGALRDRGRFHLHRWRSQFSSKRLQNTLQDAEAHCVDRGRCWSGNRGRG